jgi:hypothetical protein
MNRYGFGDYCDEMLREILDAKTVTIIDVSDYEGADFIHDLNQPIPTEWHGRFDAVIDGGSLEHVFSFPTAVANLMQMTKVGGRVFLTSPANSLCGHGFYQFSPELMYRVFAEENGFRIEDIVIVESDFPGVELTPARRSFRVVDPASVGSRVMITSGRPANLLVDAVRISDVVPFEKTPQQSDYVAAWNHNETRDKGALRQLRASLPGVIGNHLHGHYQRWKHSFANRRFFQRLRT